MFDPVKNESAAEREEKVLQQWTKEDTFKKSIEQRKGKPSFSFYDGPPFATGLPHYGHLLAGIIKDVVPRYKTMKGFRVPRRFGWDCHGLPVENEIEKSQNLSGAASIDEFGIANFNEECRKIVLRYTEEWKKTVNRIGRWVDFDDTYRTMDLPFMESVWWVFKELFDKGLVYEGYKVMPVSAKLGTPLSNFEASDNYKEVDDPSLTVSLPLLDDLDTEILVWTTTPWTLISNLALAVGADIQYVKVKDHSSAKQYILAQERLSAYYKEESEYEILDSFPGKKLEGLRYKPLFSYFEDRKEEGAFRVIIADFVTTNDGTGVVHTAPGFGEEDFYACKKEGIEVVCPVTNNGTFTSEVPEYAGVFFKDADKDIIKRLKSEGRVIQHGTIRHRYPFCWRSDTPLIYKAVSSWFVSVEKVKDKIIAANEQIHWTPGYLKHGRFGKWLEGARDWAISRNRYWGTPIPLWRSEDGEVIAIGSVTELEELTGEKIEDLHRHFIDDLTFEKDGKKFTRIKEVFDCWFESGSMPYAQNHYPFENKESTEENFPADFIAEGLDQTRGWFYTLTVLGAALFDKPAFKNVIVNGILLAEDGAKMSKSLRNYPDPTEVINKYGADAVRMYLLHSPAVRADDLCFSERGVELSLRKILIPWWNAYVFFITYARIYNWEPSKDFNIVESKPDAVIDRWILSLLNRLVEDVEKGMDDYDLSRAVEPFVGFIDQLTNWYIRRSRRRFWSEKESLDRDQAFNTLYTVLSTLTEIAAPFVPFMSETMYSNLRTKDMVASVHLRDFPEFNEAVRDESLELEMAAVQITANLGHSLRKEHKFKVRQPLPAVHIASGDPKILEFLQHQKHLIADELNVKEVTFHDDESQFVSLNVKPNFRTLGKKVGKLMRPVQQAITDFNQDQIEMLLNGIEVKITVEGQDILLKPDDVEVRREVREGMIAANEDAITVVLDTSINDELRMEGLAREVVNKISTMRRDSGFDVADRIYIQIDTTDLVRECFEVHGDYIKGEVLALGVSFEFCKEGIEWDLNGENSVIYLTKADATKDHPVKSS
ncbi:MAG: isoleucyl-tRNA synthetase [Chlamydiales bacterium]|jgi:isoleucyl-tRNA synthetase